MLPTFASRHAIRQRDVVRRVGEVHGVGSSANRDGRRGAVQHCRVRTFNAVTSDTSCLVLECFSGDSQSCTNFECTVQLVIGLGSTHLPQRAERIWNDTNCVFPCTRSMLRSPWKLHVVVVSGSSEEIQEHSAACYLCWTADTDECRLLFPSRWRCLSPNFDRTPF